MPKPFDLETENLPLVMFKLRQKEPNPAKVKMLDAIRTELECCIYDFDTIPSIEHMKRLNGAFARAHKAVEMATEYRDPEGDPAGALDAPAELQRKAA